MRHIPPLLLAVLALGLPVSPVMAGPPTARAGVVERIIAVVDHDVILLSELQKRARPFYAQIARSIPEGEVAKRGTAEQQVRVELLDRMVDERVEAALAKRLNLVVTDAEIDLALKTIADAQQLTVAELLEMAKRVSSLGTAEYRGELARSILENKLLQLYVHDRIGGFSSLSDKERGQRLEAERRAWLSELRADTYIEKRL